jgi:hypothetical protein
MMSSMTKLKAAAATPTDNTLQSKLTTNDTLTEQPALFALLQIMPPITIRLGAKIAFSFGYCLLGCCFGRHRWTRIKIETGRYVSYIGYRPSETKFFPARGSHTNSLVRFELGIGIFYQF